MKKKGNIDSVITVLVALVLGIAGMLAIFYDLGVTQQTIQSVTLEQFSNSGTTSVTLDHQRIVAGSETILNATESGGSALVENTEYSLNDQAGVVTIVNGSGTWNISYNWKPPSYGEQGSTRAILSLLSVLGAISLLVLAGRYMTKNE